MMHEPTAVTAAGATLIMNSNNNSSIITTITTPTTTKLPSQQDGSLGSSKVTSPSSSSSSSSSSSGGSSRDGRWVDIQKKTFINWCNEQLSAGGRSVDNLDTDFCDGVKLVALIESLQFRKVGRVYSRPISRIQMLQNVALALQAIRDDHIRLVNIGTEDIVNGSPKLILGLLWHLILRYQISANKTKAPPKKLMLQWFQDVLPDSSLSNFTTDWSDGIALNALVDYCKPGAAPDWRELDPRNGIANCRRAMQLAKTHLNVPKVISAEDFASRELDELSAMTYLSYFIRKDSPGYYATLNWVCRQLRTTNISNLTTDWNDGYYLCAVVHSLGGTIPGWPDLDRSDKLGNCQKGLDGVATLGIVPHLTAGELSDPSVDHLAVMALLGKFMHIIPPLPAPEKVTLNCPLDSVKQGTESRFFLTAVDGKVDISKVKVRVQGDAGETGCSVVWTETSAECKFTPSSVGQNTVHVTYDGEEVVGSPATFTVTRDVSKVKVMTSSGQCRVGKDFAIKVDSSHVQGGRYTAEARSSIGQRQTLTARVTEQGLVTVPFHPPTIGDWTVQVYMDGEAAGSPIKVSTYDPSKAFLTAPDEGYVNETLRCTVSHEGITGSDVSAEVEDGDGRVLGDVTLTPHSDTRSTTLVQFSPTTSGTYRVKAFVRGDEVKGSPVCVRVYDPGQVVALGEGLKQAARGEEASFVVYGADVIDDVTTTVEGSPFRARVTDRSLVVLLDDLTDLRDDRDHLALPYDLPTTFTFDISQAGPGTLTAEVLSPQGKLPVHVNQTSERAVVTFRAVREGEHYIHMYWSEAALECSPLLGYCMGPPLPVDASKVILTGQGAEVARATVTAEFVVDGRRAGSGKVRVELKGVRTSLPVDITPIKYDRYRCTYTPAYPGGFLLYVYWSDILVPGCPHKVTVTSKGDVSKVKVTGEGLKGGIAGSELRVFVDTKEAGPGEVTATCSNHRQGAKVDVKQNEGHHYTLCIQPTLAEKHLLQVKYDGAHVPGSPFVVRVGEPPDASKVRVFGPGIEDGVLYSFQSTFLVETHGAGAGQLAVRVRGPRGSFKVDMHRETQNDRTIKCRYSPSEPGQYVLHVRWSGAPVPGSPFTVHIVETQEELQGILRQRGLSPATNGSVWREEI
ncbi:filamin-A-like [Babylonia areolata]|uniref:filamin-A-like n=1 Tax=Babylonia areolata TaxID=304850 RepID=UPI003FD65FCD